MKVGVIYTVQGYSKYKRELIRIVNSSNIELRGFAVKALTDEENPGAAHQNVQNIAIKDSTNITIKILELFHEGYPTNDDNILIEIDNSENCTICDNFLSCREKGIEILNSRGNLLSNNTIFHNKPSGWAAFKPYGVLLDGNSANNTIYFNNLFGPAKDDGNGNYWNSTNPINYTYNDIIFSNYTGNYWYDYEGEDTNGDGIGDVPYSISDSADSKDYYPLMEPHGLSVDRIVKAIARPSIIYANRTNTILASVERTGTYPLPVQMRANLTVNDETYSKTITMNNGEHKVVRFKWNPQDTGNYHLEISVGVEDVIEAVEEENISNNNLSIDDVVVSSAPYNYSTNITSALDFLNESQHSTGSILGFSTSEQAALAITAAGEDPTSGRWKPYDYSLIDYLKNKPKDSIAWMPPGSNPSVLNDVDDFARMILVISVVGEDPTDFGGVNYLVTLKSFYDGEQFGDPDTVEDDALAILALVSCGEKKTTTNNMIINASSYIISKQNETDGGWGPKKVSDVITTSLAIQALIATGEDEAIRNALNYLENAQEDDGGFSDVETTSYAIQAIVAAGDNPLNYTKNGKNPMDYLLSLQQDDGSFNRTPDSSFYPPRTTSFVIPALGAIPNPVMIKKIREDYELPDISVSDVKLEEDEICVNTSYTVTADVRSNGGIFDVDLYSNDELVERKEVNSVWHDSLSRVEFAWKPNSTGIHNLTVVADSNDRVEELYENNNNETRKVKVVLPDLYSSEIIQPDEIYVNATNVINVVIKGTTDESFNVTLNADGERIGEKRIERIRKEIKIPFEWRPSENRAYTLNVTADAGGKVHERDEQNNTLTKPVDVVLPDLVAIIPDEIDEIYVNATNEITVTVEGTAECFNISLIKRTVVGRTTNVTCYGKKNVSMIWKPKSIGNYTITAFVDSDDDINETEEGNNNFTKTFEVLLPDIIPEEITPDVLYIDEVNTISVVVNGPAEGFNATLVVNEKGIDRSGPLCYVITPVFNGTVGTGETFFGNTTDSNLTYNITALPEVHGWEDINTLDVSIATNTSTGFVDNGDTWSVDYVAVVVNYTHNSTIRTLELNASGVISPGNWLDENNTCISDDEYAVANETTTMRLRITDTDTDAVFGNVTSVVIKVEQHVVNAITPPLEKKTVILNKANLNTYNGSIKFEWLATELGAYNLAVFLDSDDDVVETNETNNNLTRSVIVANRIDLELSSPLGGEMWDGIRNITWDATYEEPLLIDLYYSPDRGYRWIDITTNETDDGSYAWNTEEVIDGEYMIKIIARSGMVTAEDQSDIFYVRNKKSGEEWGDFHQNAGYAPCDGPDTNDTAWVSDDIGAEGSSSLIVAKGKIFVYCAGWQQKYSDYTYLVALDESSGYQLWGAKIAPREDWSWVTPAYKDGSVFVSSGEGVYRIDADTGKEEWEFRFPTGKGSVNGGPAVTSRAVYVGDWDGCHYYCINKNNATEIWNFTVSGYSQSVPAIAYGNAYFGCAYDRNRAYCVDAWDGEEVWNTSVSVGKHVCGSVTIADNIVYLTTYDFNGYGVFYALDAFNGTEIWSATIEPTDSTPAYYPSPCKSVRGYIYVAGGYATKEVRCLDAKTGNLIWRVPGPQYLESLGSWTNSPVVTKDGKVFVGKECDNGGMVPGYCGLYCLDALTGKEIWHSERGGSSPVVVNGFVYTIGDGRVFAFGNGTMPDLTVKDIKKEATYVVEEKGNITAIIENVGKSNVTKSFEVVLRHKGKVIAEKNVDPPLNISDSRHVKFEWIPEKPGENRLTVEVDPPPGNVSESDPWNNSANVNVSVEDNKPDLVSFIEAQDTAFVGEHVPVDVTIENEGYETNESFYVKFFDEGYNPPEERLISLDSTELKSLDFTWTAPNENGTYNLMVSVNNNNNSEITITNEETWTNNQNSTKVEVMPTPTPTPSPTSPPGFGPGSGGGHGGGSAGGIGEGSGTGEEGAGTGSMQVPVNVGGSASETKKEVFGFPFGNASSGASGGGGTLPLLLIALIILTVALFYFGYYKEKRAHAKHISPRAFRPEGEKRAYRRDKK